MPNFGIMRSFCFRVVGGLVTCFKVCTTFDPLRVLTVICSGVSRLYTLPFNVTFFRNFSLGALLQTFALFCITTKGVPPPILRVRWWGLSLWGTGPVDTHGGFSLQGVNYLLPNWFCPYSTPVRMDDDRVFASLFFGPVGCVRHFPCCFLFYDWIIPTWEFFFVDTVV